MPDIIDDLLAMSDDELSAKFGYDAKVKAARADLSTLASLQGEPREKAVARVEKLLNPTVYADELSWIKEDVCRQSKRSQLDEMCDCSPSAMLAP